MNRHDPRAFGLSQQTILRGWIIQGCVLVSLWAALVAGAQTVTPVEKEPSSGDSIKKFLMRDYLLGDWGGKRSELSRRGVDFEFYYAGAVPSNLDGGIRRGTVYEGILMMTLDLDSEKLIGYEGGHLHVGSLWLHSGPAFSANYVGDLNAVSLLDFPDGFRLWDFWYQQQFFEKKWTVKFGQLAVDRDFILPELYGTLGSVSFLNQTFFYPTVAFDVYDIAGFPKGSHALPSTPYGAPGVLVRWDPVPEFYAQAAVYDGNPDRSFSGTRINLNDKEGALAYFETGYRLNPGKNAAGLPGIYKVGAYFHTDDFFDVYDGTTEVINQAIGLPAARPRQHSGNYGVYLLAEQTLFREAIAADSPSQGLVGFFRVAAAPADRNLTEFGIDGGLVYTGLIPTRDYDTLGLAASYLKISDDIRDAVRDVNSAFGLGLPIPDSETVFEVSYKAQMAAWWTVQPSLQWVLHPGARVSGERIPDALVLSVLSTLRF